MQKLESKSKEQEKEITIENQMNAEVQDKKAPQEAKFTTEDKVEFKLKDIHPEALSLGLFHHRFAKPSMSEKAFNKTTTIKKLQRTDIKPEVWGRDGFARNKFVQSKLEELIMHPEMQIQYYGDKQNLPAIERIQEFSQKYGKKNIPVVLEGVTEQWKAKERWNWKDLYDRLKFQRLKVGEDDEGLTLRLDLKYFFEYLVYNQDDSPLYLFQGSLDRHGKQLLQDFEVPSYFKEDLFSLVGEKSRPPYRWFLVGPKRSGSSLHKDPLGTSAWNTSLQGHKLWIFVPPGTPKGIAKGVKFRKKGEDNQAIHFYSIILPRMIEEGAFEGIQVLQRPGDTMFVPGGWWHSVLNLDNTIAVTQNFANSDNFESVWLRTRRDRKRLALRWLNALQISRPDLAQIAISLNKKHSYLMHNELKIRTAALKDFSKLKQNQPDVEEPPLVKRYRQDIKAMGEGSALIALSSSTSSSSSSSSQSSSSSSSSDEENKSSEKKENE